MKIFISYRRADSESEAGRIYDYLGPHFGRDALFMDVDKIDPGTDFVECLNDAMSQCNTLIAVIGERWLPLRDEEPASSTLSKIGQILVPTGQ